MYDGPHRDHLILLMHIEEYCERVFDQNSAASGTRLSSRQWIDSELFVDRVSCAGDCRPIVGV